jgi:hypothetical protein
MTRVSFAAANFQGLTFSDDCDLSTVTIPESDNFRKYDRWLERLLDLKAQAEYWPEPDKQGAELFVKIYIPHAQNQNWMILNCEDIRKHICWDAADRVIAALDAM